MAKFGTIEVYEDMARFARPSSHAGFGWDG